MEDKDPFEEYYNETFNEGKPKPDPKKFAFTKDEDEPDFTDEPPTRPVSADAVKDANAIKRPINLFIRAMNALIAKTVNAEKDKGTRPDLIGTLLVGALAFTVANIYFLITKQLGDTMSKQTYEESFLRMYKSAMRDIDKEEEDDT